MLTPTLSLWDTLSAGPSGLFDALNAGAEVQALDCEVARLNGFLSIARSKDWNIGFPADSLVDDFKFLAAPASTEAFRKKAHLVAAKLKNIPRAQYASVVADATGLRFVPASVVRQHVTQVLRSTILPQLYSLTMHSPPLRTSGAITQLILEAMLREETKAASYLRIVVAYYPRLFAREHREYMEANIGQVMDRSIRVFLDAVLQDTNRFFPTSPIPPAVNP